MLVAFFFKKMFINKYGDADTVKDNLSDYMDMENDSLSKKEMEKLLEC